MAGREQELISTWRDGAVPAAPSRGWARPTAGLRWCALALPALLALVALALSLPRIGLPRDYVFDEIYYAYTAGRYVAGDTDAYDWSRPPRDRLAIEWTHPPLAKLLIAGGIFVFGDEPLGRRLPSALFGAAGAVIAYALAMRLTGNRATAAGAAGLLLLDGLYFVESRTGMSNLFLLVFTNGALLAFAHVLATPAARAGPPLLATGALLGLALATKWSAVALLGLIGLVIGARAYRLWRNTRSAGRSAAEAARAGLRTYLVWGPVALVCLPLAIYLVSYLHFFWSGYGWADLATLHQAMLAYHRGLGVVHEYSSRWWEWPLAARPVWYYIDERRRSGTYVFGNGNPLLSWPMVVAVAWVAIDWWGRQSTALTVLLIGFFGQWLPWALSPRGTFVYHFLPSVPLGCVALAAVMADGWRRGGVWRVVAVGYALAVAATFAFFYPLYTAVPLTPEQVDLRMWLQSWR